MKLTRATTPEHSPRGRRHSAGPWRSIGRQLRHPAGMAGRMMGILMGAINSRPYRLAIDALDVREHHHVLEMGFGPGLGMARLARLAHEGHVTGIDNSPTMLRQALRRNRKAVRAGRVRLLLGYWADMPLPEASFDRVLAVNVAYFFHPDGREVREGFRLLKPGGRMVLYVTHGDDMRRWPFACPDSHRLFDEGALRALLMKGGFAEHEIEMRDARLPFGITGLLAIAHKSQPEKEIRR